MSETWVIGESRLQPPSQSVTNLEGWQYYTLSESQIRTFSSVKKDLTKPVFLSVTFQNQAMFSIVSTPTIRISHQKPLQTVPRTNYRTVQKNWKLNKVQTSPVLTTRSPIDLLVTLTLHISWFNQIAVTK